VVVSIGSAVEESAFAAVRVRRYGNLCVTFTPELKILAYEFHMVAIDHSYPAGHVHAELRLLRDALLQQQRGAAAAAAGRGDAGTAGAAAAALQAGADAVQALGWGLDAQLAARTEDGYARRFMRGLKVADLVASMGDLLDAAASAPAASPLAALQAYAVAAAAAPQPDPSQARAPPRSARAARLPDAPRAGAQRARHACCLLASQLLLCRPHAQPIGGLRSAGVRVGSAGAERDVCATTQAEAVCAWDRRGGSLRCTALSVTCRVTVAHCGAADGLLCAIRDAGHGSAPAPNCRRSTLRGHGQRTCSVRNIEMTSPPNSAATTHSTAAPCATFMLDAHLPRVSHSGPHCEDSTLSSRIHCCLPWPSRDVGVA